LQITAAALGLATLRLGLTRGPARWDTNELAAQILATLP
jgi:hypothetical protein